MYLYLPNFPLWAKCDVRPRGYHEVDITLLIHLDLNVILHTHTHTHIYIYIYIEYRILSPVKPELGVIPSGQENIREYLNLPGKELNVSIIQSNKYKYNII